jgi:hypothetical protein
VIILDFGSANTCKNDIGYVQKMIDALTKIDSGNQHIVIKWQLFQVAGDNEPLEKTVFDYAYHYAYQFGYETTSSVFDEDSLQFLLTYDIPFVKIAMRAHTYYLAALVPDSIPVYVSGVNMFCVPEYPARIEDYEKLPLFEGCKLSDHTTDFTLYNKYKPSVIEWHYKLSDSTGLDAGPFSRTPEQLSRVL